MNARVEAARVAQALKAARVPDAAFEAELLVRTAAGLTRPEYFANPELDGRARERLTELTSRRAQREPFAYIAGSREFFGLEFAVTPDVLIPRPETETLVEVALAELGRERRAVVADIGTGSGVIAISVAANAPQATVVGIDVSVTALAVARANAARLAPSVRFLRASLAAAIGHADIILANLPYIPTRVLATLEPEVRDWEPRSALDGGSDGLNLVRALIDDCARRLRPRLLALELAVGQAAGIVRYVRLLGADVSVANDLAGIERVVCLRWE
jgi:release factor glutamine methyltransferase